MKEFFILGKMFITDIVYFIINGIHYPFKMIHEFLEDKKDKINTLRTRLNRLISLEEDSILDTKKNNMEHMENITDIVGKSQKQFIEEIRQVPPRQENTERHVGNKGIRSKVIMVTDEDDYDVEAERDTNPHGIECVTELDLLEEEFKTYDPYQNIPAPPVITTSVTIGDMENLQKVMGNMEAATEDEKLKAGRTLINIKETDFFQTLVNSDQLVNSAYALLNSLDGENIHSGNTQKDNFSDKYTYSY